MFCFNKCLFPNFEVRGWRLAVVRRPLVMFLGLGELMSEFRVEFVKVNHKFMSAS